MVWSVDSDVGDQSQRVILVTGATSGIGLECARALARRGAHLVLVCRNKTKTADVASLLRADGANAVDQIVCDMSDLDSVRECAQSYGGPDIDVLLLNAGTSAQSFATSAQGFERTFATNHLGHWLLTGLLLKKVKGRVVVVSSNNHHDASQINWAVVKGEARGMSGLDLYAQSKLANMLFVEELNRRLAEVESGVIAVGAHPGFAKSSILEKIENPGLWHQVYKVLMSFMAQPTANGAWPLLMAATDSEIDRDCYYAPSKWRMMHEVVGVSMRNGRKSVHVKNVEEAKKMWEESEKLCDFKYSF